MTVELEEARRQWEDALVVYLENQAVQERALLESGRCNSPETTQERWLVYKALIVEVRSGCLRRRTALPVKGLHRTYEGMILCDEHVRVAFMEVLPPARAIALHPKPSPYAARIHETDCAHLECAMCVTRPVDGNRCMNCGTALHRQWPAVYCSNWCAHEDA